MIVKYKVFLKNQKVLELEKEKNLVKLDNGFLCFYSDSNKGKIIPSEEIKEIVFEVEGTPEKEKAKGIGLHSKINEKVSGVVDRREGFSEMLFGERN